MARHRPRRVPLVLAAAAVAAMGACGPAPTAPPTAVATASPAATASIPALPVPSGPASPSPAGACTPELVTARSDGWEGAAGSRGAVVTLAASGACDLPSAPVVRLVDPHGTVVLASTARTDGAPVGVRPGAAPTFTIEASNWCDASVALPITVLLALEDASIPVDGLAITDASGLPPCNGPGQPPRVTTSDWQPG